MSPPTPGTWTRTDSLAALEAADRFDVVVVGGGIIGAAAALDAAARGLSVALIEQSDFASGSSSKSTKLLHGGIRYLPHFQFGLIREGLLEQKILAKTADFLFSSLEFALPLYRGKRLADLPRWASIPALMPYTMRIGLTLYDTLGRRSDLDRHRRLDRTDMLERLPTLRTDGLTGGFGYQDAQTDDARLTITVLKTAVRRYGVVAVAGLRAERVEAEPGGYRVEVSDGKDVRSIATRGVIAATWAFRPPPLNGAPARREVSLSKGVHMLYRAEDLGLGSSAVVLPETDDGRVLFIVPWNGMALLGTTDTPYEGPPSKAQPEQEDLEYLARHLHQYLDLDPVEPVASFAGLRALIDDGGSTAKASRGHEMVEIAPGYTQIMGGKLTAYRPIAAEAVDTLKKPLGFDADSPTETEVLFGAGIPGDFDRRLMEELGTIDCDAAYARTLIARYGTESANVVERLMAEPASRQHIGGGWATLAEAAYSALHESATSVADFTLRRTHLAWRVPDHGRADAPAIAAAMGAALGWSDVAVDEAVRAYEDELKTVGL